MSGTTCVLEKRGEEWWVVEKLYPDVQQAFLVKNILYNDPTKLQGVLVVDTVRLGKVLFIDGALQTSEEDEYYYHEMAHVAINCHLRSSNSLKVLIIGGGDGGFLREIVKHKQTVGEIVLVEIDPRIPAVIKEHIPSIPQESFKDDRVRVVYQDGAIFVKEAAASGEKFDVIIVDSPDPIGPAKSLFATPFYLNLQKILNPDGVLMRQTGSAVYQPDEWTTHACQMQEIFPEVRVIWTVIPTYIGGPFTFVLASNKKGLFDLTSKWHNALISSINGETRWYNKGSHEQVFNLSPEIRRQLKQAEYGRELVIDLSGCDYEILTSCSALTNFITELCAEIGMKPFGEPIAPDFGHAKFRTAGLSVVQLIETSNLSMHVSPHWKKACLNIFTCSTLDAERAIKFSMRELDADKAEGLLLPRGKRLESPPRKIDYFRAAVNNSEIKIEWFGYSNNKGGMTNE